jgi:hypothetical protein
MTTPSKKGRKPTAPVERLRVIFIVFYLCEKLDVKSATQLSKSLTQANNTINHGRAWEGALRNGHTPSDEKLNAAFEIKEEAKELFDSCLWIALDTEVNNKEHWLTLYPHLSKKCQRLIHTYLSLTAKQRSEGIGLNTLFEFFKLEVKETIACLLVLHAQASSRFERKNILQAMHQALCILLTIEPFFTLRNLFISYVKAFFTHKRKSTTAIWEEKALSIIDLLITLPNETYSIFKEIQKTLPLSVTNYLQTSAIETKKEKFTY